MQWLNDVWNTVDEVRLVCLDQRPLTPLLRMDHQYFSVRLNSSQQSLIGNPYFQSSGLSLTMSSDLRGSSLVSFGAFERDLQRRVRLVQLQCERDAPRIDQLVGVLKQAILLVTTIRICPRRC
jgi:hypothetical protein